MIYGAAQAFLGGMGPEWFEAICETDEEAAAKFAIYDANRKLDRLRETGQQEF